MNTIRAAVLSTLTLFITSVCADADVQALAPIELLTPPVREPIGLAVNQRGSIFVSDHAAGSVVEILPDGRTRLAAGGLWKPWGVTIDPDDRLVIGEEYGRLLRVEDDGRLTTLATRLYRPRWVSAGTAGDVYASAAGLRYPHTLLTVDQPTIGQMILRRSPDGLVVPFADGFIDAPAVAVVGNDVYAVGQTPATTTGAQETIAVRVRVAPDGQAGEPEIVGRAAVPAPAGVAVDRLGALFFAARPDGTTAAFSIFKLLPGGRPVTFASGLSAAQGLAVEADGHLLVAAPGTRPSLFRFLAPAAPVLVAAAATATTTATISGTGEPGAAVSVHRAGDASVLLAVANVDVTGRFTVDVPLETNTSNPIAVTLVGASGEGLAGVAATASIIHDDRPPVVSLGLPDSSAWLHGAVDITAEGADGGSGLGALTLHADGRVVSRVENNEASAPLRASVVLDTATLADGAHTLVLVGEDRAGNTTSAARAVTVDNTAPETIITTAPSDQTTEPRATFTLAGQDNLTPASALLFAWRLDDGPWSVPSSTTTVVLDDLPAGPHRFDAKALDAAGNQDPSPASRAFTLVAASNPIAVASAQIQTIRDAVAALVHAGQCSWGTSCLGWQSDGFHGIDILVEYGHLPPEYDENMNPWGSPYGVVGGIDAYAVKVHGLPPGPTGDATCRDLAAALTGQARSTSCWGGWDQKVFEAGFPNP